MTNTISSVKNRDEFERIAREMMRWLAENQHPHTHVVITANTAELSEGLCVISTDEYLVG